MNILKKVLPLFSAIIITVLLIIFRTMPTGHLWNGYAVLYVPDTVNDRIVENALNNAKINDYVSLNNQQFPVLFNDDSIELSMFRLNGLNDNKNYFNLRKNYFYDSLKQYRLYYIPNEYKSNIDVVIHILEKSNLEAGIDSSTSYPWIMALIVVIAAIAVTVLSKKKIIFLAESIISIIYVFCNPFYPAAISVFLILLCLYIINNIMSRKGSLKCLLSNYMIIAMTIISIVSAFSISVIAGIFFILSIAGTASMVYLCIQIKEKKYKKRKDAFQMVYIKPARMVSPTSGKTKYVIPSLLVSSILIIACFILSGSGTINGHFAKILLPGDSNISSEKLPVLKDYYKWNWDITTYPVKSLNKISNDSDKFIVYPRYSQTDDGKIQQINDYFYFDDDFIKNSYDQIDLLSFNSIEKVIKIQGENFQGGYTATSSNNITLFSIIMMIVGFTMLLFIYFSVIIKKGGKK